MRERRNIIHANVAIDRRHNDGTLCRVKAQRAGLDVLVTKTTDAEQRMVLARIIVHMAHLLVTHIIQ